VSIYKQYEHFARVDILLFAVEKERTDEVDVSRISLYEALAPKVDFWLVVAANKGTGSRSSLDMSRSILRILHYQETNISSIHIYVELTCV
jgi:hypothetical protein